MGQGPDGDGVEDSADADSAAEEKAGAEDHQLDSGPDDPNGVATAGDAGHQPVAWTRPEPSADVGAGSEAVEKDRGSESQRAHG